MIAGDIYYQERFFATGKIIRDRNIREQECSFFTIAFYEPRNL
jgi:hypothetical protein